MRLLLSRPLFATLIMSLLSPSLAFLATPSLRLPMQARATAALRTTATPRRFRAATLRTPAVMMSTKEASPSLERFNALREKLATSNLDAFLVLSGDAHNSEMPAASDKRLKAISGFSGSAGSALIAAEGVDLALEDAPGGGLVVTDGRYTIQAAQELDSSAWGIRITGTGAPSMPGYVASALGTGSKRVGVDAATLPLQALSDLEKALGDHKLIPIPTSENPLDVVWEGRPAPPMAPAYVHAEEYAGSSVADKVGTLRKDMEDAGAGAYVASDLMEVCWLLNIRGADVDNTPVCMSFAVVTRDEVRLYVERSKVEGGEVEAHLAASGVTVHDYHDVYGDVKTLAGEGLKFWLDPGTSSVATKQAAGDAALVKASPIAVPKARKNTKEMEGMQKAHVRDGAAMARTLSWLEAAVEGGEEVWELDLCAKTESLRAQDPKFKMLSFDTISASGPNGAITHYRACEESNRRLCPEELFLMDSGAQYLDGTTDVTRTMSFMKDPPREHIESCTAVLKGHILLASASFPPGTTGYQLDVLARAPLWKLGMDYAHGTGHGVGASLGVHEGPFSISPRPGNMTPLEEGMISSIEPGYYVADQYGIRIENLVRVVEEEFPGKMHKKVLRFEPLTLIPWQRRLIDVSMLNNEEIDYINNYHSRVWDEVSPLLQGEGDEKALAWLKANTAPLAA
uniref:Xaa-Pro aminopeptidase n=1 Tax=Hemiselmis andersenii TaxID=464988 RepID=A0A6U5A060_HEMAN|mmetsp:Transcript_42837/g.99489  ORF Transcript_42837/g.99489 Transcript_42837/m.99489 type:complete len:684 (-) Transcript_42837:51-2102(-)